MSSNLPPRCLCSSQVHQDKHRTCLHDASTRQLHCAAFWWTTLRVSTQMNLCLLSGHRLEMFDVNLAHSFAKHHDVNSTDFISRRSIRHEPNPCAQLWTPSVGSQLLPSHCTHAFASREAGILVQPFCEMQLLSPSLSNP